MKEISIYLLSSSSPVAKNMKCSFCLLYNDKEIIKTIDINREGSVLEAEYITLIFIFDKLIKKQKIKKLTEVNIFTNNLTVAMQIEGKYKVNSNKLTELYKKFKELSSDYQVHSQYLDKQTIKEKINNDEQYYSEKEIRKILNEIDSEESIWK
ncbi:MAG: hypothetical protein N3B13_00135 [Deltaproteobacteria bacterium]|nr:hypothetical protein [Deltaproteobacteria bacterium]